MQTLCDRRNNVISKERPTLISGYEPRAPTPAPRANESGEKLSSTSEGGFDPPTLWLWATNASCQLAATIRCFRRGGAGPALTSWFAELHNAGWGARKQREGGPPGSPVLEPHGKASLHSCGDFGRTALLSQPADLPATLVRGVHALLRIQALTMPTLCKFLWRSYALAKGDRRFHCVPRLCTLQSTRH
jgi:hypothetical protein